MLLKRFGKHKPLTKSMSLTDVRHNAHNEENMTTVKELVAR